MTGTLIWWQDESLHFLDDTLASINSSRSRGESVDCCNDLCGALNKTWNAFFQYRRIRERLNPKEVENEAKRKRADNQSFQELMLHGMNEQQALTLCKSESVRCLAEFMPRIMNHDTLLKEQYDPLNITEDVRKKRLNEHLQLLMAFEQYLEAPYDPSLRKALLEKSAKLIYVVRSNIAHSEKTPKRPDHAKAERDRVVSEVTARVIEDFFDILFDNPSRRLAVYGTLVPDGPNASVLAGMKGQWHEGKVNGVIEHRDGFLEFHWELTAEAVSVKVLSTSQLAKQFDQLDRFEGPRYQRKLVPVLIDEKKYVCNIYQGIRDASRSAFLSEGSYGASKYSSRMPSRVGDVR